ncbi:NADH-cytochrome b5 reductase [Saitozyma podzolica]|uniref:NADH-cytochrome b5 reductase n=1 Tax=Saitozyma podzolica TaxID=1890683 RepID=A0A427Y7N5_9TREE|nr:NADH-cytochrome b5 reductase [Saitozyma podzolica]
MSTKSTSVPLDLEGILARLEPHAKELGGLVVLISFLALWLLNQGSSKPRKVIDPVEWRSFKLVQKDHLSHNTARYRFALPRATDSLGLPVGQHISVMAEIDGNKVIRSYTPTTLDNDKGHFDLVVKTYEKGNISRYLSLLTIGQEVKVKGPKGKFHYQRNLVPHLVMIAGGTGLTPMYQIIRSSLQDPKDKTELALIYANVEEDDILMRKELEEMRDNSNGRFKLFPSLHLETSWLAAIYPSAFASLRSQFSALSRDNPLITRRAHLAKIGYPAPRSLSKLEDQEQHGSEDWERAGEGVSASSSGRLGKSVGVGAGTGWRSSKSRA